MAPKKFLSWLLGFVFSAMGLALVAFYATRSWAIFLSECPNNDFLSWDENIRLNTVLDQYVEFREGNFFRGILPFLESPTWPPLRSLFTFLSLYLPIDALETWKDSFFGLSFLCLIFPLSVFVLFRLTQSFFLAGFISCLVFLLTIQTVEVPAYSLSSMLETQSMFFLLLSIYAIFRLYEEDNRSQSPSKTSGFWISVSLFGFYFTKYPYGILLFMGCFLYEIFRNPKQYWNVILYLRREYTRGIRLLFYIFAIGMVLSLPILRVVTNINLNQKGFKQFMFAITFLVFVDFSIYVFRHRKKMLEIFPKTMATLWTYAIFPAFVWLYLNPDRVNALIDAQMIVNAYTRSFFLTLWTTPGENSSVPGVFDFVWGFRALVLFSAVSFLYFLVHNSYSWKEKRKDPLFAATFILFLQLLILELTTGNKQPRHVLQFIPAFGVICFVWIQRLYLLATTVWQKQTALSLFLFVSSFVVWNGFSDQGIFAGNFFSSKMFCYRGMNRNDFQPAREIAEKIEPDKKYILLNAFHDQTKYTTKGRVLASDFDLALKRKTYKLGMVRNDNKFRWKDWSGFDSILLLSDFCPDPYIEEKFETRAKTLQVKASLVSTYRESTGTACLLEYKIEP